MLDLHAHVLPGIDDGPPDLAAAIEMARGAVADGVTVLAATPHCRRDFPAVVPAELGRRVGELSAALEREGVDLEIAQGGEADVYWAHDATPEDLVAASYRGRGTDLLVETPYGALPPVFEQLLFELALRGLRILLAHPERSVSFRGDPRRLGALVDRGVLVQVTASALAGPRRSRSRRFADTLIREGRAHVIASDSHGAGIARPPLSAGLAAAERIDPVRARWMVEDVPAAVLAGDPLPPSPRAHARRPAPWRRRV